MKQSLDERSIDILSLLQELEERSGTFSSISYYLKKHNLPPVIGTVLVNSKLIAKNEFNFYNWNTIKPNVQMTSKLIKEVRRYNTDKANKHRNRYKSNTPAPQIKIQFEDDKPKKKEGFLKMIINKVKNLCK